MNIGNAWSIIKQAYLNFSNMDNFLKYLSSLTINIDPNNLVFLVRAGLQNRQTVFDINKKGSCFMFVITFWTHKKELIWQKCLLVFSFIKGLLKDSSCHLYTNNDFLTQSLKSRYVHILKFFLFISIIENFQKTLKN